MGAHLYDFHRRNKLRVYCLYDIPPANHSGELNQKNPKICVRGSVESFENSSLTRPSGRVFEVNFAQNMKYEKEKVCESLLEFQFHR